MSECLQMGESPAYEQLKGLQDIRGLRDLTSDAVRDILRASLRDQSLTVTKMGELKDMSGTNDAFNSSICSLEVSVSVSAAKQKKIPDEEPPSSPAKTPNGNLSDRSEEDRDREEEELLKEAASGEGRQQRQEDGEEDKRETRTFHFVIKSPPKASFIKMMHKISKPFLNEVTWYLELLRQIQILESDSPQNGFQMSSLVPTCYHAYSNYYAGEVSCTGGGLPWFCCLPCRSAEDGILVMQNVKHLGYRMFNKMQILPLDHFLLALSRLAHFHGRWLSYRLRGEAGQLPQGSWSPQHFKSALDTQKRVPEFVYKQLLNGTEKTVESILKLEGMAEHSDRVRKFFRVTARSQLNKFMGQVATPIDTCCHGDFWSNNIMFRYDEEEKPVDTVLVDFQLINYGHPAYDILYLLYLSSDLAFRDAHMAECLDTYWAVFKEYLVDPQGAKTIKYEKEDFLKDIEVYKTIGFVLACTLLPNVLSDIQVEAGGLMALKDLQRKQAEELKDDSKPTTREIKRRICGLVQELIRDNII